MNTVDQFMEIWEHASPDTRRLMAFMIVATKRGVWPEERFNATKPSETDAEAVELFHGIIRSIPEPQRVEVWREVDALGMVPKATPHA